jgi:Kef-type K+ transport system membrane component KefB
MAALLPNDAYYALLEIFILLAFAEVLHSLTDRIGLPQIVADVIAGMILGGFALGGLLNGLIGIDLFNVTNSYVSVFALFSIILLLFAAGLAGGFSALRKAGAAAALAAVAGALISFGIALLVFEHFFPFTTALFVSVATAATSTAVVAAVIQSERVSHTVGGKFLINVAAMDDVVALILLSIALETLGGKVSFLAITGGVIEVAVAWVILLLAAVLVVPRVLRLRAFQTSRDIPFVILFVLVAIVIGLGFSAVVGAYIAGVAIAESLAAQKTREITEVLLAIFGSLFFVVIGAEFDVHYLLNPVLVGLGLLMAATAATGKIIGVYPFARWHLKSGPDALAVTFGTIPRGEIGLIVGAIGVSLGVIGAQVLGEIVLMALVTTLVGAVLFRRTVHRLVPAEAAVSAPTEPAESAPATLP